MPESNIIYRFLDISSNNDERELSNKLSQQKAISTNEIIYYFLIIDGHRLKLKRTFVNETTVKLIPNRCNRVKNISHLFRLTPTQQMNSDLITKLKKYSVEKILQNNPLQKNVKSLDLFFYITIIIMECYIMVIYIIIVRLIGMK